MAATAMALLGDAPRQLQRMLEANVTSDIVQNRVERLVIGKTGKALL